MGQNDKLSLKIRQRLPAQLNRTIGRTQEIAAATDFLLHKHVRLLTLTGPGGVGKTRLALEVAYQLRQAFREEIVFVQLAPLSEHTFVLPMLAQMLGIEETGPYSLEERLQDFLQDKHMLLILDNFEHVLAANIAIAEILVVAPELRILVTSREALHIYGEQILEVQPLTLPDPLQSSTVFLDAPSDAIKLFVERARAVKPGFSLHMENIEAVSTICTQLDGLPLAIELAAARSRLLTPQELLERLQSRLRTLVGGARNLPSRQQTLRNTLDWSYNLLSKPEKQFFRQLGILTGSWNLDAATAIGLIDTASQDEAFSLLSSLVDKSLVRVVDDTGAETRFLLLETIREYSLECLTEHGELLAAQRRHALYFTGIAEQSETHLYSSEQQHWLARLDLEAANLWIAMRWVIKQREIHTGQRLASSLGRFLQLRSSLSDGHNWLEEIIAISQDSQPGQLLARVYYSAGTMAHLHGNLDLARSRLETSNQMADQTHDKRTQALSQGALALLASHQGHYETARALAEGSLETLQGSQDRWCRGILYSICGNIANQQCDFVAAQVRYKLSLHLLRQAGDVRSQADVMVNIGHTMQQRSKFVTAHFLYQKALLRYQQIEDRWGEVLCLNNIGHTLYLQADYASAHKALMEGMELATSLGSKRERANALLGLGRVALSRGETEQALRSIKESLRLAREISYQAGIALALCYLGDLARLREKYAEAKAYYTQSLSLMSTMGHQLAKVSLFYGLGCIALAEQDYEQTGVEMRKAIQLASQLNDALGMAIALEGFSLLCGRLDLPERAVQFLGTAANLRENVSAPVEQVYQATYQKRIESYKKNIGETAFAENWSVGHNMSLPQTLGMIANLP
ncbi:ATP-binding protein [Dictyobacter vulcani]|nr:tetratricopeptide repeat protein [Dictyobacter vulcani]